MTWAKRTVIIIIIIIIIITPVLLLLWQIVSPVPEIIYTVTLFFTCDR
jgi:hypothetical protein